MLLVLLNIIVMYSFLFFNTFDLAHLVGGDLITTFSVFFAVIIQMLIYIFVNEGNLKEVLNEEIEKSEQKQYKSMFNSL